MDCPKIQMSYDEFQTIERLLGWKTEYWDGYARLTPRRIGVDTRLNFESVSTAEDSFEGFSLIEPAPAHTEQLVDGYIAAFINSIEFCGWPFESILRDAYEDISLFFENKRGKRLSASVVMLDPKEKMVVATALITDKPEQGASLQLLYVRPSYQRQGIGTRIIHYSLRILQQLGYSQLTSRYHICNHQSRNFYHKLGFEDVKGDRYSLQTYIAWLGNEIWRRENLQMLDGLKAMKQEQNQLRAELETLEEEFWQSVREIAPATKSNQPSHTETLSDS